MSERIKVVQLITTMADGGAETLVKDYALLCDREKVEMKIVTWSEPLGSANERTLKEAGISILHLGADAVEHPTSNPFVKVYRRINKYRRFRRLVDEEKIDVIHVHLRFGRYLKALSDSTLKRVRLIYTLHNEPGKYFDPQGSGKRLFEYKEAKRLIDKYDLTIVTLHDRMHDEVRELFGTDRVVTINNGINFERFDRGLYDRTKVRASLGIAEDIRVIGHVGSYTTQKNHEHILRVFREYLKTVPNAKLMLVGKGVLKDEIGRQIEAMGMGDHVISLENRSDVPALMSVMDVFILPSRWEGFPVVLIEAQKMGLPCVISDRIDKDVVLSDDVIMVDIDAEADKWVDALNGQGKREKIRGEFKDYDIRRSINELEKLYLGN